MANFIVSYDLNGAHPSHKEVDDLLKRVGARRGRVLETVWWVQYQGSVKELYDQIATIFHREDRLLVCECLEAAWHNLLVTDDSLIAAWRNAA